MFEAIKLRGEEIVRSRPDLANSSLPVFIEPVINDNSLNKWAEEAYLKEKVQEAAKEVNSALTSCVLIWA